MKNFNVGDKVWFRDASNVQKVVADAINLGWNPAEYLTITWVTGTQITVTFGETVSVVTNIDNIVHVPIIESTQPSYYSLTIEGKNIDVFDIAKGFNLPFTLSSALKYIVRVKGDTSKRINDLKKAVECIQREIKYLEE